MTVMHRLASSVPSLQAITLGATRAPQFSGRQCTVARSWLVLGAGREHMITYECRRLPGAAGQTADISFDTMATAQRHRESGIEEFQAWAIANAIKYGVTGGVATKAGLGELKPR